MNEFEKQNTNYIAAGEVTQKDTKHIFTRFASEDYSFPLMLCEFIDNSISSYENAYIENEFSKIDFSDLEIKFIFNEKPADIYSNNNSTITIIDNSNGMTLDDVKNAAVMYDTFKKGTNDSKKGDDDLNQHGIGLKAAAHWLGKDVVVSSKTKWCEEINHYRVITSDKKDNDKCVTEIFKSPWNNNDFLPEKNSSGTKIFIKGINKQSEKFIYLKDENKCIYKSFLQIFLGIKYKNYIKKGLSIKFDFISNDEKANTSFVINAFEIKPFKLQDLIDLLNSRKNVDIDKEIKEFKNKLINIKNKSNDDYEKCKNDLIDKILNNDEALIDVPIKFNEKEYIANIGIISSSKNKYKIFNNKNEEIDILSNKDLSLKNDDWNKYNSLQGLNFFHHNRGLLIGPIDTKNNIQGKLPTPMTFAKNQKSINGLSTPIRLFGYINISGIKTEINKANLYINNNDKLGITNQLEEIWDKIFKDVLNEITKIDTTKRNNEVTEKKIKNLEEDLVEKTKKSFENMTINTIKKENNSIEIQTTFDYLENKYAFDIYESVDSNDLYSFKQNYDKTDKKNINTYDIYYNKNHPFWNPLNQEVKADDKIKFRTMLFPILITFVLTEIIQKENKDLFIEKTYSEIINNICKNWDSIIDQNNEDNDEQ